MKLSILIATTVDRRDMFNNLYINFNTQISLLDLRNQVEVIYIEDNKQMSIGNKRNELLKLASGEWIVFFDSDDKPANNYVELIYNTIINNPDIDCIGINVNMTTNGNNPQRCCHRLKYQTWRDNVDGWDYVRNITHFNPVKKELALKVGFKDLRFGEDKDYSDRLFPLLKKEFYIEQPIFDYLYTNKQSHNIKYGI
jgi:glycosyltransferase involved in cell wall biosynthesis